MENASITVTGGPGITGMELRDYIAKALDDLGFAVAIVEETGGYEYNYRQMKIYGMPGAGEPVNLMVANAPPRS